MVKHISNEIAGKVELLVGSKHDFEDGDFVMMDHVIGMDRLIKPTDPELPLSINKTIHKVKVINKQSFYIEDTTIYTPFQRNGIVKIVKVPFKIKFQPLESCLTSKPLPLDPILS